MELKLYDKTNVLRLSCNPGESSTHTHAVMGDDVISLSFVHYDFVTLKVDDYVDFDGKRYWVMQSYVPKQYSSVEWKYEVKLYAAESRIKNALVLSEQGEADFSLTSSARVIAKLIVDNINRLFSTTEWKVGEVIVSDNITLDFNGTYCHKALADLAAKANTEYWFDGTTLNICRCEHGEAIALGYGKGLVNMEKTSADNAKFFTRLFPLGSTRNIDRDKYGFKRLQLPGREKYREQNMEFGIIEHFEEKAFADIYPRRTGVVGSVRSVDKTGEDGNPFTIYYFTDPTIPFDPNDYEIGGLVKNVTFVTGELSGCDFDVNYDSKNKEFEVITQFPYDDMQLPGGVLIPKAGDKYNLFNISMPDEYHALAEAEYSQAVDKYLLENKYDKAVYKASTDYIDIANRNLTLKIGQRIRLESDLYFATGYRDSRITKVTRKLMCPTMADIEVSDLLNKGKVADLENGISDAKSYAKEAMAGLPDVIKSWEVTAPTDSNIFTAKKVKKDFLSKTERDVAKELITFENGLRIGTDIVPGLLGGSIDKDANAELKSLTLREFLNVPELRYNRVSVIAGEQWSAPGGGIIEGVNESNNRFKLKLEPGELPALQVFDLCKGIFNTGTGFATAYFRIENIAKSGDDYIVLYSLKPGTALHPQPFMHFVAYGNTFDTSRQASAVQTREYLRFMAGVNTWDISASMIRAHIGNMSGMTINGVDFSGYSGLLRNFYFDGTLAQLAPAIADSEQNTKDYVDEKTAAENLALQNFIDNTYTQEMLAMQAQMDGQVESFFFQQDPTLNNAPANGWTTTAIKESHLNDTYTNLNTGKSWRWTKYGNAYGWLAIADTATEKALMIAGQAKDTADSKRRTFIATPYPPYDAGDLWITSGDDLMKCIYARASGSYVASDWDKGTKYTDDSAVNNMQIGGRNLVLNSMSKPVDGYWSFNGWTAFPVQFDNGLAFKTVSGWGLYTCDIGTYEGSVCVSFEIKCIEEKDSSGNTTSTLRGVRLVNGNTYDAAMKGVYIPISWDWQKHTFVLNVSNPNVGFFMQLLREGANDSAAISVRNLKIERGNKPTDYTVAPEDVQSEIDDAKNTGAAYNSMGEYSSATYYTGSRYQRDVVWISNSAMATGREYFVAKITSGTFVNVPTSDKTKWESIGAQFSSIATDFLLARKIQGEEIDTDALIVKSLQTSKDVNADQRIVIDHNTNSMVMSKSGKDVLIISGKKVNKLEDQLNEIGGLVIPIQKSGELKNVERIGYMPNVETNIHGLTVFTYHVPVGFVCKVPPMKLTIDASLGGYLGGGMHEQARTESCISMYVNDELVYSNILRLVIAPSSLMDSDKKEFTTPEMIITAPGDYNIKITLQTQVTGYFEYMTSYAKSSAKGYLSNINANDNILVYAISELTELFSNGMMSKYSTTKYMAVINTDTDPVWIARDGNYGLQVCKEGVKIMRNGINWTNL
ncbi:MAG: hypothetical protein RSE51_09865 [Bacteroidales bacterium]